MLAERAAARLATAGRRANDRMDFRAALELEAAWANEWVDARAAARAADTVAARGEAAGDHSGAMLARAMALFWRTHSGDVPVTGEAEKLCRAALPFEEERDDPRRLALLWEQLAHSAHNRMQLDDAVDASERALRYRRLAGDSPSYTGFDWSLILGPRPADEGLRMLDELAVGRPPGAADLGRAVLLSMLGRTAEAWPLAEARSDHLRDVGGGRFVGDEYLAVIAMVEGDRQRACRHHTELIDMAPPGSDGVMASYRLILARDLCYLGRLDEAEPLLRQAQAVPAGPVERALGPSVEALLLAGQGELKKAETLVRLGIIAAETETDNLWLQAWGYEDLATVLEPTGRIDEAREALERTLVLAERKRCLPYAGRLRDQIDSLGVH
jgi:tetratricopeptide (TPR) repeat protein